MIGFFKKKPEIPKTTLGTGFKHKKHGISEEETISLKDDDRKGHFFCFGTTRVGKTRLIENMIEQDIKKGYNVVLIDPKGDNELFSKVYQIATDSGREDDLLLINPIYPEYSSTLNPLADFFMPEELVGHIVAGVEAGREKFFYNVAYEVSLAVVLSFLQIAKHRNMEPRFTYSDVKNFVNREALGVLYAELQSINTHESLQLARDIKQIMASPADYFSKISSSLRVALTELSAGNIGKLIGHGYQNELIRKIESKEGVIAVVQLGSLLTRKASYTLGKVICSMIQSSVGRVFSSQEEKYDKPLCLYLDEAQNIMYHGIEELFAKAGGAGVWIHAFCQSISQIYAALGNDTGNVILDNTNSKLFMRVPDVTTADYISRFFGEKRYVRSIYSIEGGVSGSETIESMIKPEDVLSFKPRDFLLQTYAGSYQGKTSLVNPADIKILLPKLRSYA